MYVFSFSSKFLFMPNESYFPYLTVRTNSGSEYRPRAGPPGSDQRRCYGTLAKLHNLPALQFAHL